MIYKNFHLYFFDNNLGGPLCLSKICPIWDFHSASKREVKPFTVEVEHQ